MKNLIEEKWDEFYEKVVQERNRRLMLECIRKRLNTKGKVK